MVESVTVVLAGKTFAIDTKNLDGYFIFDEAQRVAKRNGKRLMTKDELESLCECENWWDKERRGRVFKMQTPDGGFEEVFFPAAGRRFSSDGSLGLVGTNGYYWSSSPNGTNGHYLGFYSSSVSPAFSTYRHYGFSVRLVKDL